MKEKTTTASKPKTTKGNIKEFNRTAWNYMRKRYSLEEAQLILLHIAVCPAKVNGLPADLLRYFNIDYTEKLGIKIEDYEILNEHPELILYEGYQMRGSGGEIVIEKKEGNQPSFLEEKIKKGEITEVGIYIEPTASQKWLSGIGSFLMMGGFLLVLIFIVAIVLLISILTKGC